MEGQNNKKICPVCGAECIPEAKFCEKCGTKLGNRKAFCFKCGAELEPGANFCTKCGTRQMTAGPEKPRTEQQNVQPADSHVTKAESNTTTAKKGGGSRFLPVILIAAAAAVLVVAAVVIILLKRDEIGERVRNIFAVEEEQEKEEPEDVEEIIEEVPEEVPEEPDLSNVTINAYDSDSVEISGLIEERDGALIFVFDSPQTIYLYDGDLQSDEVVESVPDITVDTDSQALVDDTYAGRNVTVSGRMWKENSEIMFLPEEILYAEPEKDDPGIHRYEIVTGDVTWDEAFAQSVERGGYLARISSPEEYQYITDMLNSGGYTRYQFYLGGRRDDGGTEYYWVNMKNQFLGECLNDSDSWLGSYWYENEPSFRDTGSGAGGEIAENVISLFYVSGTWYMNDSSSDMAGFYPDLMSGKVAYIIEYEE